MSKPTQWNLVASPEIHITLNAADLEDDTNVKYYPGRLVVRCTAESADGGRKRVPEIKTIGAARSTPYTDKELYSEMGKAKMPKIVLDAIKKMYADAIDEDVTKTP